MKAILILDMPSSCEECKYNTSYYQIDDICSADKTRCPLKPLPSKKEAKEIKHLEDFVYMKTQYDFITNNIVVKIKYDLETIFTEGYNSCLDEILGDEE